jgi:hypothetical protein
MKQGAICTLLLGIVLMISPSASATWYFTHGHSGRIEDEQAVVDYPNYVGWGLVFGLHPATSTWVHFAVPSLGGGNRGVRFIRLKCMIESTDAWISDVHVYDGNILVQELKGHWANNLFDLQLDLGRVWKIQRGLGVSVKVNTGVEQLHNLFQFHAVGANFVPVPAP